MNETLDASMFKASSAAPTQDVVVGQEMQVPAARHQRSVTVHLPGADLNSQKMLEEEDKKSPSLLNELMPISWSRWGATTDFGLITIQIIEFGFFLLSNSKIKSCRPPSKFRSRDKRMNPKTQYCMIHLSLEVYTLGHTPNTLLFVAAAQL
ncbi:hypothetical protein ARMSODRAFT_978713 [Armillaria solidipes]|uniref:Uncharacterized protein n=1 Tax=Armillaria solidipes TaxID=1076256 RepID=A0A2H3B2C6_9AGAR|nr:hypothetical protein ARMSODRAFT_978713 [Armillaria solidipes]